MYMNLASAGRNGTKELPNGSKKRNILSSTGSSCEMKDVVCVRHNVGKVESEVPIEHSKIKYYLEVSKLRQFRCWGHSRKRKENRINPSSAENGQRTKVF